VTAGGSIPLYYQWLFNGHTIAGSNTTTLQVQNATTNQTGYYAVVVDNSFGVVTSTLAYLSVETYPSIISQSPATNYLYTARGATETLSVIATGTAIQYQWFSNSIPIAGSTYSYLILSNITSAVNGCLFWVVVSNGVGSVSCAHIQLIVTMASRQLATGYWQGVGYWPYCAMTNTIKVGPPVGTLVYAVQEGLSEYPTDSSNDVYNFIVGPINNGGSVDATNFLIKWGPFFDDQPRTLTYVIIQPATITNWAQFAGVLSADGTNYDVMGDSLMNLLPYHPADTVDGNIVVNINMLPSNTSSSIDGQITINELSAYASAWKNGSYWAVDPNPIPINYMTSAGLIWRTSGFYRIDTSQSPPACWVSVPPPAGSAQLAMVSQEVVQAKPNGGPIPHGGSISTAVCSMTNICSPNAPFVVTLTISPANTVGAYAVQDLFPVGWVVTNINASGVVDSYNNEVKWGPFFNNTAQTLTYQITPPSNILGTNSFTGIASFDGTGIAITGVRQVISSTTPPVFQQLTRSNGVLTLNWSAVPSLNYQIQYSTNLVSTNWFNLGSLISATNSSISASDSMTNLQRFYRVMLVQ